MAKHFVTSKFHHKATGKYVEAGTIFETEEHPKALIDAGCLRPATKADLASQAEDENVDNSENDGTENDDAETGSADNDADDKSEIDSDTGEDDGDDSEGNTEDAGDTQPMTNAQRKAAEKAAKAARNK